MNRRKFLKKASIAAASTLTLPYILPSGSLFAQTGARKANKVVICLFAGGVRHLESIQKAEGNLMPNTLWGSEAISGDLAGSMSPLPGAILPQPLQAYGTLYKNFSYAKGATGHYQGYTTCMIGRYTDNSLNLRSRPPYPTLFEYYMKHNSPQQTALNAWWVTNSGGAMALLNYSNHPEYGYKYGANHFSPGGLMQMDSHKQIGSMVEQMHEKELKIAAMKGFLNQNFSKPQTVTPGLSNTPEDTQKIQAFLTDLYKDLADGKNWDPWKVGNAFYMDMHAIFYTEQILKRFTPELTVVNLDNVDICHYDFTNYCDALRKADYALAHLWDTIQKTPGMKDETVLLVAPEIGRNAEPNTVRDRNGRLALDHTDNDMSRRMFCLVVGPPNIIKQGQIIDEKARDNGTKLFESVDLVATAAHILGYDHAIPGYLEGQPLYEAFV